MSSSIKTALLSAIAISLIAPVASANPAHHGGTTGAQAEGSPFTGQSGMGNMSGMGGQMMPMMMNMHMSMMRQMHGGGAGQLASLFSDDAAPEDIMARFDANSDGAIDLSEFATWDAEVHREQMVDRFQELDADGVDAISAEELAAAHEAARAGGMMNGGMMGGGMMNGGMAQEGMMDDETNNGEGN